MDNFRAGVLFGTGFTIAFVAIAYAFFFILEEMETTDRVDLGSKDVEIVSSRIVELENRIVVLGNSRNISGETLSVVTLDVELFDSDGELLDRCDAAIRRLMPDEEQSFKVVCSSCNDIAVEDIVTHEIEVIGTIWID